MHVWPTECWVRCATFVAVIRAWKSSTVLVGAAFTLSVALLFAKAGMMRDRATAERPLITNHLYSPAAADPELRDQRAAERITRRSAQATPTAARSVVVRQPAAAPQPAVRETSSSARATPAAAAGSVVIERPFHVVVASFKGREGAETELKRLRAKGYKEAFIGVFNEGKYHSLIAANFKREDHARVMLSELKTKHGIEGFIYNKTD